MTSATLTPSKEALMEVFQTPNPSLVSIARWKYEWKTTAGRVRVDNYTSALKMLRKMKDIDPLFYQICRDDADSSTYIAFYKPEHEAYFKLHQGLG